MTSGWHVDLVQVSHPTVHYIKHQATGTDWKMAVSKTLRDAYAAHPDSLWRLDLVRYRVVTDEDVEGVVF